MLSFRKRQPAPEPPKVLSWMANLGCGSTIHPAWDNFDIVPTAAGVRPINLLEPLPFPEASYQICYASHVLEHLSRAAGGRFLRSIYRVLQPGGIARIVVPDLESICRLYLRYLEAAVSGEANGEEHHEWMCMEMIDQMTRSASGGFMGRLWYSRPLPARKLIVNRLGREAEEWIEKFDRLFEEGAPPLRPDQVYELDDPTPAAELEFHREGEVHRWMYDRVSLGRLLREVGFSRVTVRGASESEIPGFSAYLLDTDSDGRARKPDSLFMEAVK